MYSKSFRQPVDFLHYYGKNPVNVSLTINYDENTYYLLKIYWKSLSDDKTCVCCLFLHVMGSRLQCIHAICPGGTQKSRNFNPSKAVPAGRHFSFKICFVPESLWPVKCIAFSDFWTGQIAIKAIITWSSNPSHYTVSTWHLYNDVVKCLDSN